MPAPTIKTSTRFLVTAGHLTKKNGTSKQAHHICTFSQTTAFK